MSHISQIYQIKIFNMYLFWRAYEEIMKLEINVYIDFWVLFYVLPFNLVKLSLWF